jgi:antitoxin HicB
MANEEKGLDYFLHQNYTVELKPYGDGSYFARIQELSGCVAEGESLEETLRLIEDAKAAWLEVALEAQEEIPLPDEGRYSGRFLVRIPTSLHRRLAESARKERTSLNQYIQYLITSGLESRGHAFNPRVCDTKLFPVDEGAVWSDSVFGMLDVGSQHVQAA